MNTEKQSKTNSSVISSSFSAPSPEQMPSDDMLEMIQLQRLASTQSAPRDTMSPKTILQLQRTIGNQAVSRLLKGPAPSRPVKQTAPDNHVQRLIIELWNVQQGQPNKKPWNAYSKLIAQNWPGVNNETMALPIVTNLIKTLPKQVDLDSLANSTAITKKIYDHYEKNIGALLLEIQNGATRRSLEFSILLSGEHAVVNATNLNWFYQNHQQDVVLNWSEWFEYTNKRQWDPGTYDAEISVSIGGNRWGVIHVHYPRGAENDEIEENNIDTIHIKSNKWSDYKYVLGGVWPGLCQAVIDQNINARPVAQLV